MKKVKSVAIAVFGVLILAIFLFMIISILDKKQNKKIEQINSSIMETSQGVTEVSIAPTESIVESEIEEEIEEIQLETDAGEFESHADYIQETVAPDVEIKHEITIPKEKLNEIVSGWGETYNLDKDNMQVVSFEETENEYYISFTDANSAEVYYVRLTKDYMLVKTGKVE